LLLELFASLGRHRFEKDAIPMRPSPTPPLARIRKCQRAGVLRALDVCESDLASHFLKLRKSQSRRSHSVFDPEGLKYRTFPLPTFVVLVKPTEGVCEAQSASGLEHAIEAGKGTSRVGQREQCKRAKHAVKGPVRELKLFGVHHLKLNPPEGSSLDLVGCSTEHRAAEVDPDKATAVRRTARRLNQNGAGTSRHIEDHIVWLNSDMCDELAPEVGEKARPDQVVSSGRPREHGDNVVC
jgi:hypothetical protein